MKAKRSHFAISVLAAWVVCLGCSTDGSTQKLAELRQRFITDSLPTVASSVEQLVATELLDSVSVVGRIHGGELEPFDENSASFTLTVLPEPGHSHDDPGDCPFCKRKAENAPMVLVKFRDDDGEPIRMPVDKLFGLKKNQDVLVSGSATRFDNVLVIDANQISILPDLEAARQLVSVDAIEDDSEVIDANTTDQIDAESAQ